MKCVADIRKELCGTTMFQGTVERMMKGYVIHDEDQYGCSDSAWIGFFSRCGPRRARAISEHFCVGD